MRRLDLLITQSRRSTENLDFTTDAGIQDNEIIQYFNDAQDEMFGLILNLFPDMYQAEEIIDVVASQEAYDIPADAYVGQRIEKVEYSRNGQDRDYYILKKGDKRERLNGTSGNPSFYIRQGNKILIQPKPDVGGTLRVLYQRSIPTLDIRRAVVGSVTLGANTITNLTLDTTQNIDDVELVDNDYITIVNKFGVVKMKAIPITSIDTTTGVITIDAGFTFADGETISAGDYVLRGTNATTHSQLPVECENYLLEYANTRLQMRDSSADANDLALLVQKMEAGMKQTFAEPDGDVNQIPILDTQFLTSWE